jgi:glycosyltransferase involved in cell wall biosynthesis
LKRAAGGGLATISYVRALRRALATFCPDVLHSHGLKMHLLAACARPAGSVLVWHLHDYVGARPVSRRLLRQLRHRCRAIVANSDSVAADARAQIGDDMEICTVHNAVDLGRFSPEGPCLDLDAMSGLPPAEPGTIRIGLVATFARWKGHLTFIEALRQLALGREPQRHPVRAYIIGGPVYETDGSQYTRDELQNAARLAGLDAAVGFTGFVDDSASAMRALDVVVHASTEPEPFGLTIAEAMAAGRAVVVSYAGGAAELVVPEQDALAHRPGDAEDLTRQIRRLVQDAALRARLGMAARQSAMKRFDPARLADQLLRLYAALEHPAAA